MTGRVTPVPSGPAAAPVPSGPAGAPDPAEAAELAAVCRHATELAASLPGPLQRVRVTSGGTHVELEWDRTTTVAVPMPVQAMPPGGEVVVTIEPAPDPDEHVVTAPTVGTVYWAPEPGAAPFVREGEAVAEGQQVAILEAMKLMNPVDADLAGTVRRILVPDGTSVEYGQPLLVLDRAAAA